jgi:hypothetical protein
LIGGAFLVLASVEVASDGGTHPDTILKLGTKDGSWTDLADRRAVQGGPASGSGTASGMWFAAQRSPSPRRTDLAAAYRFDTCVAGPARPTSGWRPPTAA